MSEFKVFKFKEMAESSRKRQRVPAQREMTAKHLERLELFETFVFKPSRVLDLNILQAMEWDVEVLGFINAIGWGFLLNPHSKIFPTAIKEFLATVDVTQSTNSFGETVYSVDFWMNGGYRSLSLDEFNVQAGFFTRAAQLEYRDAVCEYPDGLTPNEMWKEITGQSDYHAGVKGTRLPSALRICHKLITGSIHARQKSPESVTRPDLLALYCMATGQKANPGFFFLEHIKNLGVREGSEARRGYIMIATLLSTLAEAWGCPDGTDAGDLAPKPIGALTLNNMKMIVKVGRQYVRATTDDFSELFTDIELPGDEDPQPEAGTSQHDRAYFDARFDALQRSIDS